MQSPTLRAVVFSAMLTTPAIAQSSKEPVVAYVSGMTLTLADQSGQVAQEIQLGRRVSEFALSKDRNLLVIVSPDTEHGGALSLLDLRTRVWTRLTNGHLWMKHLEKPETEVYDNPQFSPDGRSIVFAIHGNLPGDGNDADENSGPLAVYDLDSHQARVLKSTLDIPGEVHEPCSESSPMWSPNGKWIIFNCEVGAEITDAQGAALRDLKIGTEAKPYASVTGWVGNHCVSYEQMSDADAQSHPENAEKLLLNLRTSSSRQFRGLADPSQPASIQSKGADQYVVTREKTWKLPRKSIAIIIGGEKPSFIPHGCE